VRKLIRPSALLAQNGRSPSRCVPHGGHIVMPDIPGVGLEAKSELIKVMRELAE
jgi:hypothetical protein